jgi:hypothetical protein
MSEKDDARLPAVYDAIRFWNDVLLNLGSPFHFGPVSVAEAISHDELRHDELHRYPGLANLLDWAAGWYDLPPSRLANIQGDVIVALSDGERSSAAMFGSSRRVLIVIRKFRVYQTRPPTTLNGAQDTIAHELGHAIGLGHNGDPTSLMCRPCRFGEREGFSHLTDDEKRLLLEMYPPSWPESSND